MDQLLEGIYEYIPSCNHSVEIEEIILWKFAVNGYFVMVLVIERLAKILLTIRCAIYLN